MPDLDTTAPSSDSRPPRVARRGTPKERLRYRFDIALSRGPSVVIGWLGLLTLGLIAVTAIVVTVFRLTGVNGGERLGIFEAFWQSLLRVVDAGTFAGDTGWVARLVGLAITVAGIFIAGSLIGLIASGVDQRIEELRKGRSSVLESDHTVIVGWSPRVPAIVSEIVRANESRKHAAIVVLADADKTEMEEVLRTAIPESRTTMFVCRRGEPWLLENLELVNLRNARSVIVVSDGDDASAVKSILAICALDDGNETLGVFSGHIVAEVESTEIATSLKALIGDNLVCVSSDDVVAELTAQACRQRGLSTVFRELLDFDGDELYFAHFPELEGRTYAQCQLRFERCALLGVLTADGDVVLNPAADRTVVSGDQLIGIAEDDSLFLSTPDVDANVLVVDTDTREQLQRRMVVVGWSALGPRVIAELDEFLDENTTIEVLVDPSMVDIDAVRAKMSTRNVAVEIGELSGGPEAIATHAARIAFNEVIVLGYRDVLTPDQADARTLLTLLAFRQVRQVEDLGPVRMVAELLDQRNARLAAASGADDFIVSDELTSLMLAQLSERRELELVFDDLFDKSGCSIELRPATNFGAHRATCFADVVATASMLGQTAIGYRRHETATVVINPAKSAPLSLGVDDAILVVADGN